MTKPNQSSVKFKIEQNLTILRNATGLNYQLDISGIPTGYKLVMTDLITGGEWDISHRMKPSEFLNFIYGVNIFYYDNEKRKTDKRFQLRKEVEDDSHGGANENI